MTDRVPIAVSACLLGERVRYDGETVDSPWLDAAWHDCFEIHSVCPEVEVGMGVPREPVDLHVMVGDRCGGDEARARRIRVLGRETGRDWTIVLDDHARERVRRFVEQGICGVILKSRSPSCGVGNVKLVQPDGSIRREGTGRFAEALLRMAPEIPVVQECDVADAELIDRWLASVFALARRRGLRPRPF